MSEVERFFRCPYADRLDAQALFDGLDLNIANIAENIIYDEFGQPAWCVANGWVSAEVADLLGAYAVTIEPAPENP